MTTFIMPSSLALVPSLEMAWQDMDSSFERFCLTAGIGAIEQMLCEDAQRFVGTPHNRGGDRVGHRWGRTKGKIGFHGGMAGYQTGPFLLYPSEFELGEEQLVGAASVHRFLKGWLKQLQGGTQAP